MSRSGPSPSPFPSSRSASPSSRASSRRARASRQLSRRATSCPTAPASSRTPAVGQRGCPAEARGGLGAQRTTRRSRRSLTLVPESGWSQTSSIFLMTLLSDFSTDCFFLSSSAACGAGRRVCEARADGGRAGPLDLVAKHEPGELTQVLLDCGFLRQPQVQAQESEVREERGSGGGPHRARLAEAGAVEPLELVAGSRSAADAELHCRLGRAGEQCGARRSQRTAARVDGRAVGTVINVSELRARALHRW